MRFAFALALLTAACSSGSDRPIGPGGNVGGGTGETADAGGSGDGPGNGIIRGRLCRVDDLRFPSQCPTVTGLEGILIEDVLSGNTTTSDDSGNFELAASADEGLYTQIRVAHTDAAYRDVLVPIGLSLGQAVGVELPLVPALVWEDMVFVVGLSEPDQSASLAAYFKRNDEAVANVVVQAPEGTSGVPVYDRPAGPNDWDIGGGSGQFGASILTGIPTDSPKLDIVLTPSGGENISALGVALEPNVLTFITVPLP